MAHAELRVISGKQAGSSIPLPVGKFLVGREEDCHLRPNSDLVSRHHCVFTVDEYSVRLRDLGSTNGTLVNGERIRGGVMLNPGDKVSIGKIEFEVVIGSHQDTLPEMAIGSNTSIRNPPQPAVEETPSTAQTMTEMPAMPGQPPFAPPVGDTQYMPPGGMPQMQPGIGYPMGYPPQMMPPYGYPQAYPGYPGGMYPQMGYPPMGGQMPGMYPQQMPMQAAAAVEAPPAPAKEAIPIKLPNPEETGAKAPAPAAPKADAAPKSKEATAKEEAPKMAGDIIQQYLKRRPTTGS